MTAPFTPILGRVLIEPIIPDDTTASGLVLVSHSSSLETMGRVVAVAQPQNPQVEALRAALEQARMLSWEDPDLRAEWAALIEDTRTPESAVSVGDVVLFSWTSGQEIRMDDVRYLIMPESDVLAVVTEDTDG